MTNVICRRLDIAGRQVVSYRTINLSIILYDQQRTHDDIW